MFANRSDYSVFVYSERTEMIVTLSCRAHRNEMQRVRSKRWKSMSLRLPRSSARTTGPCRGSKPEIWFLVISVTCLVSPPLCCIVFVLFISFI